ncbi:MAG: phosphatase PAP2 family protein [Bacteroidota bacterium]
MSQALHPLEPAKNHYAVLGKLDSEPNPDDYELESKRFPVSKYHPVALLYVMASPYYLKAPQIEGLKTSLKFPANSSERTRAELDFLLEWQAKRTKEQEARASEILAPIGYWPHISVKKDHEKYSKNMHDLFYLGRALIGDECSYKTYPATAKLLAGVTTDMRIMEFTVKYHLLRARPYDLEPKLEPLALMSSPSFASGHTLWAYIQAFTWSELLPEKRDGFLKIAYEIGESREIMGIHYPSDEEASRILAHDMLNAMWGNPEFTSDLNAAKEEWKE